MRRFLLPILLALTAGACADSTGPAAEPFVGTFTLVAVDGQELPAMVLEVEGDRFEVVSGTFTILENGGYTSSVAIRVTEEGVPTVFPAATTGTYTAEGSHLEFMSQGGNLIEGHFADGRLSVTDEGAAVFEFAR